MVALQRLGLKTAYAGRFGSDAAGSLGLRLVRDEGVDVEFAEVVKDARNQIAFIIIDARSGERTIVWDRDDRLGVQPQRSAHEFRLPWTRAAY